MSTKPSGSQENGFEIIAVEVRKQSSEVMVIVHGKGRSAYTVIPMDPYRLALDFTVGRSSLRVRTFPVKHAMLKRIRIEPHRETLRLIFDLAQRARYAVKQGQGFFALTFRLSSLGH